MRMSNVAESPILLDTPSEAIRTLLPNHLQDLRRSGLTDTTIESWGCFSIGPTNAALLKQFGSGVTAPGLALPLRSPGSLKTNVFVYKPDNPRELAKKMKGHICKYELPRHTLNRIHVPLATQLLF